MQHRDDYNNPHKIMVVVIKAKRLGPSPLPPVWPVETSGWVVVALESPFPVNWETVLILCASQGWRRWMRGQDGSSSGAWEPLSPSREAQRGWDGAPVLPIPPREESRCPAPVFQNTQLDSSWRVTAACSAGRGGAQSMTRWLPR